MRATALLLFAGLFATLQEPEAPESETQQPTAQEPPNADPYREPPLELLLELDGERHELVLGRSFELTVGETRHQARVSGRGSRAFDASGVRLRYPAEFLYEYDDEIEGLEVYSLDGPETLIMIQVYDEELDLVDVIAGTLEAVLEELEPFDVETVEHELELGPHRLASTQLRITIEEEGLAFTQDYFAFHGSGGTGVVCVQFGYDEGGKLSRESSRAERLLRSSFDFDPAPSQAR